MAHEFVGTLILLIWNIEKTHYRVLDKHNVCLKFQPMKGLRILIDDLNELNIHDVRWDLDGNFEADILLVEHHIPHSFISVDYLTEEAERQGWKTRGRDRLALIENESREFKSYCFPYDGSDDDLWSERERQNRFEEIVLSVLSDIKNSLSDGWSKQYLLVLFIGFILGILVTALFCWLLL